MNVSELLELIIQHYSCNTAIIKGIEVANMNNQFNPEEKAVDIGGMLNLYIDIFVEPFTEGISDADNDV